MFKKQLLSNFFPFLFILILTVIFFGKTLTGRQIFVTPDIGTSDVLYYEYSTKSFLAESLKRGSLPLWNPKIATGFPQMGTITGSFNPINLILFKFLPMPLAFNIGLVTIFLTTGVFTYLFARVLGLSKLASLFSSTTFTFSGFLITQIVHFNVIQTLSFFPAALYLVEQYFQKRRLFFAILLAFIVGFQILSGFYQLVLYSLIVLFLYIFWRILFLKESYKNKLLTLVILFMAIFAGFAVAAVQLLPSLEFTQISTREGGVSAGEVKLFPYPIKHLITFIWPYLLGDPRTGTYPAFSQNWGIFWESTGFVGIIPIILALIAIIWGIKNHVVRFFLILTALSFLLLLGKHSPIFFLFKVPPLSMFRVPSRWIVFFTFSLTILAGVGFEFAGQKIANKINRAAIPAFLILLVAAVNIFLFAKNYHLTGDAKKWLATPQTAEFLKKDQDTYRIFTLGNQIVWNNQLLKHGWKDAGDKFLAFGEALDPNWNVVFGIEHSSSNATITSKRDELIRTILTDNIKLKKTGTGDNVFLISEEARKILSLQNVKYIISPFNIFGYKTPTGTLELIFTSQTKPQYYIYENKTVLPRVSVVSTIKVARTIKEQYQSVTAADFDPKTTVILEKVIKQQFKQAISEAKIDEYSNHSVKISADMADNGVLVLADAYYPGWKAYVDGKEVEILAANINQRAVIINKGTHNVIFKFQPKSFMAGAVVSSLTSLALIFLLIGSFILKKN